MEGETGGVLSIGRRLSAQPTDQTLCILMESKALKYTATITDLREGIVQTKNRNKNTAALQKEVLDLKVTYLDDLKRNKEYHKLASIWIHEMYHVWTGGKH